MTYLPLPSFYDASNAGVWGYRPDDTALLAAAMDWKLTHGIKAASTDRKKVTFLGIDMQQDFCLPNGTLYVGGRSGTGAVDDSARTAEFLYQNLGLITDFRPTLDTHFPFQIFSPAFWMLPDGSHPGPLSFIIAREGDRAPYMDGSEVYVLDAGEIEPSALAAATVVKGNLAWLKTFVRHYCVTLADSGKYALILWPEHCLLGGQGHNLMGVIQEARMFHAYVRGSQNQPEIKGGHPLTENYSILGPEVTLRHDGQVLAQKNAQFVQTLLSSDYVIVAGQAASHCVAWSVNDLLSEIQAVDPGLTQKVYVMTDCMSSVAIPDGKGGFVADFTPLYEQARDGWAAAGMHLVESTTPIDQWPDLIL